MYCLCCNAKLQKTKNSDRYRWLKAIKIINYPTRFRCNKCHLRGIIRCPYCNETLYKNVEKCCMDMTLVSYFSKKYNRTYIDRETIAYKYNCSHNRLFIG